MGGGTVPSSLPAGPGNILVPATVGPRMNLKPVEGIPLKGVRLFEMARIKGSKPQRCALYMCDTLHNAKEMNRILCTLYQVP